MSKNIVSTIASDARFFRNLFGFLAILLTIFALVLANQAQTEDPFWQTDISPEHILSPQTNTRPDILWMRGGAQGQFYDIKYSANGQTCASTSGDGTTKIWRSSDGVLLRTIFAGTYNQLSLSTDGQKIAIKARVSGSDFVQVYNVSDGALMTSFPASTIQGTGVALSPDGSLVSNAGKIFRTSDGALLQDLSSIPGNGTDFTSSAFSPNGQLLAINRGNDNNNPYNLGLFNTSNWTLVRSMPLSGGGQPVFRPNGQYVAVPTSSGPAVFNVSNGSLITLPSPGGHTATFSADGQYLASGISGTVKLWQASALPTWTYLRQIPVETNIAAPSVAFSDSNELVTALSEIKVFDPATGTNTRNFEGHTGQVRGVAFSPDGQMFATSTLIGNCDAVRIWRVSDSVLLNKLTFSSANCASRIFSVAFSADNQFIIASGANSQAINTVALKKWRLSDNALIYDVSQANGQFEASVISPDRHILAAGNNSSGLALISATDGSLIRTIVTGGVATPLAFSPDGQTLAATNSTGVFTGVNIYRVSDGTLMQSFPASSPGNINQSVCGAFSPDGLSFATGLNGSPPANIFQYRVSDAALLQTFSGHTQGVNDLKFTPDGQKLVSIGLDNTLRFWQVSSGALLQTYTEELYESYPIYPQMAISPDGTKIGYARLDATAVMIRNPFPATPPTTYTINGHITSNSSALPGVSVGLSGSSTASATTDATGSYSFANLTAGGNYTVTPTLTNNTFVPASSTFSNLTANQTADFIASLNCTYTLSPTSPQSVAAMAGTLDVTVTALTGCAWTAASNSGFLNLTGGAGGNGNGTVNVSIAENTGAMRSGTLTIAGQTYTIDQADGTPSCTYSLAPTSANVSAAGGSGSFSVTTQSGCSWTAQSNSAFLTTTSNGTGNGPVNYNYTANSSAVRSATITVAGQVFTLNQAAAQSNCVSVSLPNNQTATVGSVISVPVTVSDLTGKNIESYDFTVQFDSNVLTPASPLVDTVGTLSTGLSVIANSPQAGRVIVSAAGASPINSGAGTLVFLKFNVVGASQTSTALTWQNFQFNDGDPCANLSNGQFTVAAGALNGTIIYGTTPGGQAAKFVSGGLMTAAGTPQVTTTTNSGGTYRLANLGTGNYTVTPSKNGDINGISSLDASRIQQYLVGLISLTANQIIAADANNSGTVTSLDASRIQQYLVGIQSAHIIGQWKFVPASKQYNSVTSEVTGEDYQAILVGEVSGNWTAPVSLLEGFYPKELVNTGILLENDLLETLIKLAAESRQTDEPAGQKNSEQESLAGIPVSPTSNASAGMGTVVVIPVTAGDLTGSTVESFDFSLFYDPEILQPASPSSSTTGTLSGNCSVLSNAPVSGKLVVSGACGNPPITSGQGTLVNLRFNVIGSGNQQTVLTFMNPQNGQNTFQFNDGDPTAIPGNGSFRVLGPTAANAGVSGRVITQTGIGVARAAMSLINANGGIMTTITNSFGYFEFNNVELGNTYIVEVRSKEWQFAPQVIHLTEGIENLNFICNSRLNP